MRFVGNNTQTTLKWPFTIERLVFRAAMVLQIDEDELRDSY